MSNVSAKVSTLDTLALNGNRMREGAIADMKDAYEGQGKEGILGDLGGNDSQASGFVLSTMTVVETFVSCHPQEYG